MYPPLYLKWITNRVLLYSTGNSAQCYVAAWMEGKFRGEWIYLYVWLSPSTVHLKPSLPPHAEPTHWKKDSDAGRDWGQEEKGTTEDEMAGWHHGLDGHESE